MVSRVSGESVFSSPTSMTPISLVMPHLVTMARARRVACMMSDEAPEVTFSAPKMSSSAIRPPMHTSSLASICLRDIDVWSPLGSCIT